MPRTSRVCADEFANIVGRNSKAIIPRNLAECAIEEAVDHYLDEARERVVIVNDVGTVTQEAGGEGSDSPRGRTR